MAYRDRLASFPLLELDAFPPAGTVATPELVPPEVVAAAAFAASVETALAALAKLPTVSSNATDQAVRVGDLFGRQPSSLAKLPLNGKTTANERIRLAIAGLEVGQETVSKAGLAAYVARPRRDPADVVRVKMRDGTTRQVLQEGHTRVGAAKLRGEAEVDVRVWDFEENDRGGFDPVPRGLHKRGLTHRQKLTLLYSDDQPRAEDGKFGEGSGTEGKSSEPRTANGPNHRVLTAEDVTAIASLPRDKFAAEVEGGVTLPMHRGVTSHGETGDDEPKWYASGEGTAKGYAKADGVVRSEDITMQRPYVAASSVDVIYAGKETMARLAGEGYDGMLCQFKTLAIKGMSGKGGRPAANEIYAVKFPANLREKAEKVRSKSLSYRSKLALLLYDEDQPRDPDGKFGEGDGSAAKTDDTAKPAADKSSPTKAAVTPQIAKQATADIKAYVARGAMSKKDGEKAIKKIAKGGADADRVVNELLPRFATMHGSPKLSAREACVINVSLVDDPPAHAGLLVAVWLDAETTEAIAPGASEPLHITLAYCPTGPDGAELDAVMAHDVADALRPVVAQFPKLAGKIGGSGMFLPSETSDDQPVSYLVPDVPGLSDLRTAVALTLEEVSVPPSKIHGWAPHMTVETLPETVAATPLTFERVTVTFGEDEIDLLLGGSTDLSAYHLWNEDQPRAADGKFGEGEGSAYHGTTKEAAAAIKSGGFTTAAGPNGQLLGEGVYLTGKQHEAQGYGAEVLKVDISELKVKDFSTETAYKRFLAKQEPDDWEPSTMATVMKGLGYDAVRIDRNVVCVFNPAKLKVNLSETINLPSVDDVKHDGLIGVQKRKRRKVVKYQGVTLSRQPTPFEEKVLDLVGIPKTLDAAVARLLERGKTDHFTLAITVDQVAHYGAGQVLQEMVRQGAPAALATAEVPVVSVHLTDAIERAYAAEVQAIRESVAASLADRGIAGDRLVAWTQDLVDRRMPALEKRYAAQAVNEAFILGRNTAITRLRAQTLAARGEPGPIELGYKDDRGRFISRAEAVAEGYVEVDAVVQTAVMDTGTCEECEDVDGEVMDFGDSRQRELRPPYVRCLGGKRCRCIQIALLEDGSEVDIDQLDDPE